MTLIDEELTVHDADLDEYAHLVCWSCHDEWHAGHRKIEDVTVVCGAPMTPEEAPAEAPKCPRCLELEEYVQKNGMCKDHG